MNEIENEKAILEETPDFEGQRAILDEEKNERDRLRRFYFYITGIYFCMILIILIAHLTIDIYINYSLVSNENCENINLAIADNDFKIINIADESSCVPEYNIDYYNNRRATFNLDIFGDKSLIFNKTNQMDAAGKYCKLNCDDNGDGWPDYNIDLNGDGIADLNIVKDPSKDSICDLNCDLNLDGLPDTNIDLNGDGKADINITGDDYTKPLYNIDYKGNRVPTFNVRQSDGTVTNKVNDAIDNKACTTNCDADGDGWPDYNIKLPNSDTIINEVIKKDSTIVAYEYAKTIDWKCYYSKNLNSCVSGASITKNTYINIDMNGDGFPDVNVSSDGGENITNPLNNHTFINNVEVVLNEDINEDGLPEFNIDLNGNGLPDLNIAEGEDKVCVKDCDTNFDGVPDYKIAYNSTTTHRIGVNNINLDIDYDGVCDVNCDTDYDLYPNYNVDITGDNSPNINIDYDYDKNPDFNIDTTGNGYADTKLSAFLDGTCNWNCDGEVANPVETGTTGTNVDTNGDGWPDINVDLTGNGTCDINCDNGTRNIDNDGDYFIDSENHTKNMVIDKSDRESFYILNPIDIVATDIDPGWEGIYVLTITNNTYYAMRYRFFWDDVINEFSDTNNLEYFVNRNGGRYIDLERMPRDYTVVKDNMIIRSNSTVKYVMKITWRETGLNQNIDSGRRLKGEFRVETIK